MPLTHAAVCAQHTLAQQPVWLTSLVRQAYGFQQSSALMPTLTLSTSTTHLLYVVNRATPVGTACRVNLPPVLPSTEFLEE